MISSFYYPSKHCCSGGKFKEIQEGEYKGYFRCNKCKKLYMPRHMVGSEKDMKDREFKISDVYYEHKRCQCGTQKFTHAPEIKGVEPKWQGLYICDKCSRLHRTITKALLDEDDIMSSIDYLIATTYRHFVYCREFDLAKEFKDIMDRCKNQNIALEVLHSFAEFISGGLGGRYGC